MSKIVRRIILTSLLTFVIYPLSYAPLHRLLIGRDNRSLEPYEVEFVSILDPAPPAWKMAFLPVQLLIDHTPLRKPLLWWSSYWGVQAQHR